MTTEQLLTKIREFATNNYCSCEGRIHDPENLMEKLLRQCDEWEKEASNEDWKKMKSEELNGFTFDRWWKEGEIELENFIQSLLKNKK